MTLSNLDLYPADLLGHDLEDDGPALGGDRHTCTRCGKAVLKSSYGVVYGSALTERCDA